MIHHKAQEVKAMPQRKQRYLSTAEVAANLACSARHARSLMVEMNAIDISAGKVARWRVSCEEFDAWIEKRRAERKAPPPSMILRMKQWPSKQKRSSLNSTGTAPIKLTQPRKSARRWESGKSGKQTPPPVRAIDPGQRSAEAQRRT